MIAATASGSAAVASRIARVAAGGVVRDRETTGPSALPATAVITPRIAPRWAVPNRRGVGAVSTPSRLRRWGRAPLRSSAPSSRE